MSKWFLGISPKAVGVLALTLGVALTSCSAKSSPLDGTWELRVDMFGGYLTHRIVCSGDTWTRSIGENGAFEEMSKGTLKVEGKTIIATETHEKDGTNWVPTTEAEPIQTWTLSADGKTLTAVFSYGGAMEFTKK